MCPLMELSHGIEVEDMSKQDRQGVRTASDIEQKYNFGKSFAEVMGIARDAQTTANKASEEAGNANKKLTPDEIFNLLTDNGANRGMYKDEDGEIYFNASYIKSGALIADLIQSGKLTSKDGAMVLNLDDNSLHSYDSESCTTTDIMYGYFALRDSSNNTRVHIGSLYDLMSDDYLFSILVKSKLGNHFSIDAYVDDVEIVAPSYSNPSTTESHKVRWKDNGDGTYSLIGV